MKTFNTQLIVPFIITLLLTGCMPDSLTKFKKEEPTTKKSSAASSGGTTTPTGPVVDPTGTPVTFDEPTYFSFGSVANTPMGGVVGTAFSREAFMDGSLGEESKADLFFERCDLIVSGVNSQSVALPAGLSLNSNECVVTGTPTTAKSIVTAFCTDGVSFDQATCEANPLVWSGTACTLPDLEYATAAKCNAAFHKWYGVGSTIPYRIRLNYHDADGVQKSVYTTMNLGVFKTLTTLNYTQSDKIILNVSGSGSYSNIAPLLTTTATVGAYPRLSMIAGSPDVMGVAKVVDPALNLIGVNKLLPLKVTSTTPFIVNTFISKQGDASKIGRIFKIDAPNRIVYVENISADNKTFLKTELICSNTITGACGTAYSILDISETYVYKKDQIIDNDKQFYTEIFKIVKAVNIYEVGSMINPIHPITTSEFNSSNGITYTISPALPCNDPTDPNDCVSIDPATGIISGTFSSFLANTEFTVTATNPISSTTFKLSLGAIIGPGDLALTNKQIITVSSTAFFVEGETLYQPITPPLAEALTARIIKILNPYQMAIETFNGTFSPGESLDSNGSSYKAEKAIIIPYGSCTNTNYITKATCEAATYAWSPSSAIHYNVALTTNTTGDYVAGDPVSSAAGTGIGAIGLVAHVQTLANDVLFVQYLTGTSTSTAAAKTFYDGDTLNTGALVTRIESPNMKFTLANAATFTKGSDIVTSASSAAYIYNKSGNTLSVNEISKASTGLPFTAGQTVYNHETVALSTGNSTIDAASITFDNYYIFERGKNMTVKGNVSSGSGIIYSISPALPIGLTLDSNTGSIKGSASSISAKKDYIITGSNFIGNTKTVVSIEVKDYFEIQEKSGAASFLMHKVGDYQNNRKCRVDASDIASLSNAKALDIRCFMDGEEQDVRQTDLVLKAVSGPGICEYVQYSPYYFYGWSPATSTDTSSRYTAQAVIRSGCNGVSNTGSAPTVDMCEGNYSSFGTNYPNCDEGYLSYYTETYDNACIITSRTKTIVNCGGKRARCIAGPVKDIMSDANLDLGKRNEIIPAVTGMTKTYTHAAPMTEGDSNLNIRIANGTINNQCLSGAAQTLLWKDATAATSRYASPFGSDSNPFYTFTCLNSAYEIKARVRVIVRDWDETFKINNDIFNQSFTAPASQMNNAGVDPIFNEDYNNTLDWDDPSFYGAAATFTGGTCATHAAGSCTATNAIFISDAACTTAGGSVTTPASCSNGTDTNEVACLFNGETWSRPVCTFNNQYQCRKYGGTWTGDEEYKFPNDQLGNLLGL